MCTLCWRTAQLPKLPACECQQATHCAHLLTHPVSRACHTCCATASRTTVLCQLSQGALHARCGAAICVLQVELGMQRMNELMKLCNKFMLRRTSTVLKELLPTKVEQVGSSVATQWPLKIPCSTCHSPTQLVPANHTVVTSPFLPPLSAGGVLQADQAAAEAV